MKFVIVCPFGMRTGGPESCFQLSDTLMRHGLEAEMWLLTEADGTALRELIQGGKNFTNIRFDLPERVNTFEDYLRYLAKPFVSFEPKEKVLFVLPEDYAWMVPLFVSQQVLVWWLSVDAGFRALGELNTNYLRLPYVRHAHQSVYAERFLRALGLDSTPLGDYTVVDGRGDPPPQTARPKSVVFSAEQKVIVKLDLLERAIAQRCAYAQFTRIASMHKSEVSAAFRNARVYIDLGHFPGRDRAVREAVLLGANAIIANCGSGAVTEDFPVPDIYRVKPLDLDYIAALCAHMLEQPEVHTASFAPWRAAIAQERERFAAQVVGTFARYLAQ